MSEKDAGSLIGRIRHWSLEYGRRRRCRAEGAGFYIEALDGRVLLSATPSTIYSFANGADGQSPTAITVDSGGNLFGTTYASGANGDGMVWELDSGGSTINPLYSFTGGTDGKYPLGIVVDGNGNLFGTAQDGGANGVGAVWELAKGSSAVATLYSFTGGSDGEVPEGITIDGNGDLFGTAEVGGGNGVGVIWELAKGSSAVSTLYSFTGGADGDYPAGITIDSSGNLFGVTALAGTGGDGTIWELAKGASAVSTLYTFPDLNGSPVYLGGIAIDSGGNLFGTTGDGGDDGSGSLWELAQGSSAADTLYSFTGGPDGGGPYGIAIDGAGNIYGNAEYGGDIGYGAVWEVAGAAQSGDQSALVGQFTGMIPANAAVGTVISPGLQITNPAGNDGIVNGEETTDYYLSTTPDLSGATDLLGSNPYLMNLASGASETETATVTIPEDVEPGTYYLVAQIDPDQNIESADVDDIAVSGAIQIAPQLGGQFTGEIPPLAGEGAVISPGLEITNPADGQAIVDGDETTVYYLSTTPDLSGIITPALATNNYGLDLNPGDSFTESQEVTIPGNLSAGAYYYLVAQLDANQAIYPSDTNDFVVSDAFQIGSDISGEFTNPPPQEAKPGDSGQIAFALSNAEGGAEAKGSYTVTLELERGTPDPGFGDILAGSASGAIDLAGGATSDDIDATINIPQSVTPGTYYLIGIINDSGGGINDVNDSDKVFYSDAITISGPDLAKTLYNFSPGDGEPARGGEVANDIVVDSDGNLYGVSAFGGVFGIGDVWELAKGSQTLSTLYSFTGGSDGYWPYGITIDGEGNLYGTTYEGGEISYEGQALDGAGTIWELAKGSGRVDTLYTFGSPSPVLGSAILPLGIAVDSEGNLYGTDASGYYPGDPNNPMSSGGYYSNTYATVWGLQRGSDAVTTLFDLNGQEFGLPALGSIAMGNDGTLYGTAYTLLDAGPGIVWSLDPDSGFSTIYAFGAGGDGSVPIGLTVDGNGDLIGTGGGGANGQGSVWALDPGTGQFATLYSFTGGADGAEPYGVALASAGEIYGVTSGGGANGDGTIYELQQLTGKMTGSIPTTAQPGDSISPDLQITDALYPVENGAEKTVYYFSTTDDLSGIVGDPLGENDYQLSLDPGDTQAETEDLTIPQNISAGTYYIVAQIDATGAINPGDTDNFAASGAITINPAIATHFSVSAPANATAGSAVTVTVTALDQAGETATGYSGTVHLTSSDGLAVLPGDATLTNGVGEFSVELWSAGDQTVTAKDTQTGSITGSSEAISVTPAAMMIDGPYTFAADAIVGAISGTGSVTVDSGVTITIAPGSGASHVNSITLMGTAKLDITDNAVVINYGTNNPSPASAVGAAIASAYSNGAFTGTGITSSEVAAVNASLGDSHAYAIAYADASDPAVAADHFTPGTLVIMPALVGDANLDGKVSYADFQLLSANFNGKNTTWDGGNFNYGAGTSYTDFQLLSADFNDSKPPDNTDANLDLSLAVEVDVVGSVNVAAAKLPGSKSSGNVIAAVGAVSDGSIVDGASFSNVPISGGLLESDDSVLG